MALLPLTADDPVTLGPYRLTGRLGAGGMGVVYLGYDQDGSPAAVKTLSAGADDSRRARIQLEAEHLKAVDSPRVARLVASDTSGTIPWIALAYVAGQSLAETPTPLPAPALRALAEGLAEALSALAAADIVHRDIKPSNIILGPDGPVLVDLGISRTGTAAALTQSGTAIGSPVWMAPEQLQGRPVTTATDVWGWGAVVGFAATGRPPFGDGALEALAWRIQSGKPDLEGLPRELAGPVTAALAKDPAQRPLPARVLDPAPGAPATYDVSGPTAPLVLPFAAPAPASAEAVGAAPLGNTRVSATTAVLVAAVVVLSALLVASTLRGGDPGAAATGSLGSAPQNPAPGQPTPMPTGFEPLPSLEPLPSPTSQRGKRADKKKSAWSARGSILRTGSAPAFPDVLPDYALRQQFRTVHRIFESDDWRAVRSVAGSTNRCEDVRILVRWQAAGDEKVRSAYVSAGDRDGTLIKQGAARAGWMSGDGCRRPAFKNDRDNDRLNTVLLEVQVWRAG